MGRPISPVGEARLKKEQALAKLRTLQSDGLEGRLLDRDQVRACWAAAMAALRDRAMGLGDRVASRGAGRTADELCKVVAAEVCSKLVEIGRNRINAGILCSKYA
jgi:hypothetical protein